MSADLNPDRSDLAAREAINANKEKECAVCKDLRVLETTLQCGHKFCHLCIKGVFLTNRPCPLCRTPIVGDDLDRSEQLDPKMRFKRADGSEYDELPPLMVFKEEEPDDDVQFIKCVRGRFYWLYKSNTEDSWWRYEGRVEALLESEFQKDSKKTVETFICGVKYYCNFTEMSQESEAGNRRTIKRVGEAEFDSLLQEQKISGVAGVLIPK
ncbi:unnamed protein product [Caenorhabditis sp. 36 PRJEB53466]|nr:unnamed protein product [Caenorhabditis sp. 36 PRJEB53466]